MMGLINDAAHVSICSYSAASIVVAVEGPLSDSSFSHSALLEPSPEKKKNRVQTMEGSKGPKSTAELSVLSRARDGGGGGGKAKAKSLMMDPRVGQTSCYMFASFPPNG